MLLHPNHLAARIDVRVAELRVLAARTPVDYWRERNRSHRMNLTRKPFAEFATELVTGLCAGRGDEPIAGSARFKVIEIAPGDWRLQMIFDHAVEVVGDESFSSREAAVEEIVDRLVNCSGLDEIRTEPIQ